MSLFDWAKFIRCNTACYRDTNGDNVVFLDSHSIVLIPLNCRNLQFLRSIPAIIVKALESIGSQCATREPVSAEKATILHHSTRDGIP